MQKNDAMFASIFPETLGYYFEKVGEAVGDRKPHEFGSGMLKLIAEVVQEFKDAVETRISLDSVPGLAYEIDEVEYPLAELQKYFDADDSKLNSKDAAIFTSFVYQRVKSLQEMAESLDEEG